MRKRNESIAMIYDRMSMMRKKMMKENDSECLSIYEDEYEFLLDLCYEADIYVDPKNRSYKYKENNKEGLKDENER